MDPTSVSTTAACPTIVPRRANFAGAPREIARSKAAADTVDHELCIPATNVRSTSPDPVQRALLARRASAGRA
jgi:hypothetical protein